jgi:tetratricopeptide (TPR) repeat protein
MESESSPSGGIIGLLAWFEVHKKHVGIGAAAAVLGMFLALILVQHQTRKELSASEALSDVRGLFSAAASTPGGTVEALSKVVSSHAGTKAAARALLISAGLLFSEAKSAADYAEAQKRFTQVTQEYPDSPWLPQAHLGIAASLSAQGKTNEAIAKYEEINRRYASAPIHDQSRLALARLYEASKPEEALKLYDELTKPNPNNPSSVVLMEAKLREDDLLKERPELAKLKASLNPPQTPPPTATTPPVQITPMTNRVVSTVTGAAARLMTNAQRLTITNRPGTGQAPQIKLTPTPSPGAASPAPAPAPPK